MRASGLVTLMGILNLIVGGLGILIGSCSCTCVSAGFWAIGAVQDQSLPADERLEIEMIEYVIKEVPYYREVEIGRGVLTVLLSALLVISGLGLMNLEAWGRWLSLGCALLLMVLHLGYVLYEFEFVIPARERFEAKAPVVMSTSQELLASKLGIAVASFFFAGYGLILFLAMMSDAVKNTLQPPEPPPGDRPGGGESSIRKG
jgi:hypothetical protein